MTSIEIAPGPSRDNVQGHTVFAHVTNAPLFTGTTVQPLCLILAMPKSSAFTRSPLVTRDSGRGPSVAGKTGTEISPVSTGLSYSVIGQVAFAAAWRLCAYALFVRPVMVAKLTARSSTWRVRS